MKICVFLFEYMVDFIRKTALIFLLFLIVFLFPAGGTSVCGRAGLGLSAAHLCACRGGVDPGAQSDNTGPHGPALLPAGAAGRPAQTPVLQRVSPPNV